ncbi:MAG TPA: hypothetical protein PL028_06870 [Bacteroidales bacterium]|nr:hypothetical protein [Bacteroidales bacterium]
MLNIINYETKEVLMPYELYVDINIPLENQIEVNDSVLEFITWQRDIVMIELNTGEFFTITTSNIEHIFEIYYDLKILSNDMKVIKTDTLLVI